MNIIFMRHGEATDNVKEIISDREIYWSILTEKGINTVLESINALPENIDKIYVSPFPRTIETAHLVYQKYNKADIIIEQRLHEIDHGKYSGKQNNEDLDNTRIKQIGGDYFVRFGEYGENKYEIEERLCNFLVDVHKNNFDKNTVMIVSHGSITSYMKRLLNIKTAHINVGKVEEFFDVDFSPLFKYIKKLKKIKSEIIKNRINQVKALNISESLKQNLIKLNKKEFNNIEYSGKYFEKYMSGLTTNNLVEKISSKFENGVILVCFYNNFEHFAKKWMEHYIKIGIKNYVLVDNNSTDNSTKIIENYANKVNISFWQINENYDCYKMCGWKQQIFEHYGIGNEYLTVDSDELFIYKDYETIKFSEYIKNKNISYIKSLMLDVYTKKNLFEGELEEFKYIDRGTYKISTKIPYKQRFYGGPRSRIFNINPSLQKIPYIKYTGKEIFANDHYYYPWNINDKSIFCSYLLHYKFLKEHKKMYEEFAQDGRHWNNSHEYKIYKEILSKKNVTFYDENISILLEELDYSFKN